MVLRYPSYISLFANPDDLFLFIYFKLIAKLFFILMLKDQQHELSCENTKTTIFEDEETDIVQKIKLFDNIFMKAESSQTLDDLDLNMYQKAGKWSEIWEKINFKKSLTKHLYWSLIKHV